MNTDIRRLSRKVCLLGDFSVGKTSLVRRFIYERFDDRYLSTLGVKVSRKVVNISTESESIELTLMLWDLAGGEDGGILVPNYLRGASGAVIVGDITRAETVESLHGYLDQLNSTTQDAHIVLAANKADLADNLAVTQSSIDKLANELGLACFLTSAKTGERVEELFLELGRGIVSETNN